MRRSSVKFIVIGRINYSATNKINAYKGTCLMKEFFEKLYDWIIFERRN